MKKTFAALVVVWTGLVLSACGAVHNTVLTPPDNIAAIRSITPPVVQVSSKEQNADAVSLNDQWKRMAEDALQSLLTGKNITTATGAQAAVVCRINVVYGNRALRYWVGFGAGSGSMEVIVELKDASGKVRYATSSKADLSGGRFGGDMTAVARKTIEAAVKEFGSRL